MVTYILASAKTLWKKLKENIGVLDVQQQFANWDDELKAENPAHKSVKMDATTENPTPWVVDDMRLHAGRAMRPEIVKYQT